MVQETECELSCAALKKLNIDAIIRHSIFLLAAMGVYLHISVYLVNIMPAFNRLWLWSNGYQDQLETEMQWVGFLLHLFLTRVPVIL